MTERDDWVARARAVRIDDEICRRSIVLKRSGAELVGPCPKCGGTDRFSIKPSEGVWNCRRCKPKEIAGDVIGFVRWLDDVDFITACTTLTGEPPPDMKPNGKDRTAEANKIVAARFDYSDEAGRVLFQVERVEFQNPDGTFILTADGKRRKTFRQRRPDPGRPGEWLWNVDGVPVVPYGLPALIEAVATQRTILIVEGEAKVDLLRSWNMPATCCAGGAKKWRSEHSQYLRGADALILPDNDTTGRAHLNVVAVSLSDVAASVRLLDLPGLPTTGDIVDWAKNGGTVEKLQDLIARSAKPWTPAGDAKSSAHGFEWRWHFHGDADVSETRAWLVQDVIPEVGAGLLSGQWGTYKTFVALDLAGGVMSGKPFINFPIRRRGGVLFFACEGQGEVAIRLAAVIKAKCESGRAPFAWVDDCPRLLDPAAPKILAAMVKQAADRMMKDFGLPVALVIVDTAGKAAGYTKVGDENDPVMGQLVMKALAGLAKEAQLFALGIDHFGKNADVGTRGASSKEADGDVVLALLGEKNISGAVTNPRLAIRKRRTGPNGIEFPFRTQVMNMGNDENGDPITTLTIDWSATAAEPNANSGDDSWSKSLRLLRRILMNVLADHGAEERPFLDGPAVRAVDIEVVRTEFYKSYPAEGDAKSKQATKRKAFNRAIANAQTANLIGLRDIGTATVVWFARIKDCHVQNADGDGT